MTTDRFNPDYRDQSMIKSENGRWVDYKDYEALTERLKTVTRIVSELKRGKGNDAGRD